MADEDLHPLDAAIEKFRRKRTGPGKRKGRMGQVVHAEGLKWLERHYSSLPEEEKSDFVTPLICWVKRMHTQNEKVLQIVETHPAKIGINGHFGHAEPPFLQTQRTQKFLPLFL